MFKTQFSNYACAGDAITADVDGFDVTATIYFDDANESPELHSDGFWPSLDPDNAGYIGPKSRRALQRHTAKAKEVLRAWQNAEWFYCGVAVTVARAGVELTGRFDHALWGIECNYPGSKNNNYLGVVANELLSEALDAARTKITELVD